MEVKEKKREIVKKKIEEGEWLQMHKHTNNSRARATKVHTRRKQWINIWAPLIDPEQFDICSGPLCSFCYIYFTRT